MKILITGGTGMIGYAIKKHIQNQNKHQYIFIGSKD